MNGSITIEIIVTIWLTSLSIGFIAGAILRLSLLLHGMLSAFLMGSIGRMGLSNYILMLTQDWVIGLIVILGMLSGYPCGYFAADMLYRIVRD